MNGNFKEHPDDKTTFSLIDSIEFQIKKKILHQND